MRITKGELFEVGFWLAFAAGAFALTFKFDQEIEIYKYGANGWPRVVIILIALAAIGQLFHDVKARLAMEASGETKTQAPATERGGREYFLRVGAILVTPFIFAFLLDSVGFYFLAPFFIAVVLYLGGERRWTRLVGVSLFIYALAILFFAKLLFVGLPAGNTHPFYDFSNWLLIMIR